MKNFIDNPSFEWVPSFDVGSDGILKIERHYPNGKQASVTVFSGNGIVERYTISASGRLVSDRQRRLSYIRLHKVNRR